MSDKQARLVYRRANDQNGGTCEMWDIGNGDGFYVDYNPCPSDTGVQETMAFPADPRRNAVKSWQELGVWRKDMTGGRAMRELGYEPIEEAEHGTD